MLNTADASCPTGAPWPAALARPYRVDHTQCCVPVLPHVSPAVQVESCGQCTPCREGTGWIYDILTRMTKEEAGLHEIDMLVRLCATCVRLVSRMRPHNLASWYLMTPAVEQVAHAEERCIRRLQAASPMRSMCVVLRCHPTQNKLQAGCRERAPLSYNIVAAAAAAVGHAGEAD